MINTNVLTSGNAILNSKCESSPKFEELNVMRCVRRQRIKTQHLYPKIAKLLFTYS